MSKEQILDKLTEEKPYLTSKYHLSELGLFGSSARGEDTLLSDIDVLFTVEENKSFSLFDMVDLKDYLEKKLGKTVDIVDKKMLKSVFRDQILKETIMV
ncbi:MAG: nucleotidyltransferase domain-containing protein [Candidatus Paceibacterota bacterium]|jgi:hypothetical protein